MTEANGTPRAPSPERTYALLALLATAVGAGLRLHRLYAQPLWNDEVITRHVSEAPWNEILVYFLHDSSPALYYLFLKGWLALGANSEAAIRVLPATFGALSVPVAYTVLKSILGRRAGLATAFLLAVHPYALYYSQENRYVSLLGLLGLLVVGAYARFLRRGGWSDAALLALAATAMLHTHYYALFLLAALGAHFAVFRLRTRDDGLKIATVGAAVFLLFLPWLGVFLMQFERGQPARETFGAARQLFLTGAFFLFGGSEWRLPPVPLSSLEPDRWNYLPTVAVLLAPVAVLLAGGVARDLRRREARGLVTFAAFVPIVLVMIASRWVPLYRPKYLVPLLPFYWGLAVCGAEGWIARGGARRAVAVASSALIALLIGGAATRVHTSPAYAREPWGEATNWLAAHERRGDALLLYNPYSASAWRYTYAGRLPTVNIVSPFTRPMVPPPAVIEERLARLGRAYRRLWVLDYQAVVHDPERSVLAACERRFHEIPYLADARDPRFTLRAFATTEGGMRDAFTERVDFGEGRYMPRQLASGWTVNLDGTAWMAREGTVVLRRTDGQELVQVAFFVHLPYFGGTPVTATLSVEGRPVMSRTIARADNVVLTAVIPQELDGRDLLRVTLAFDRAFLPDDLLHDGDRAPKTALVYGVSLLQLGYGLR